MQKDFNHPADRVSRNYSEDELKEIGKLCDGRFPPPSIVQAMFLYEYQRESEVECLFQGDMFQLARAGDHYKSWQSRVTEFGEQLHAFRKQLAVRNTENGFAATKVRLDAMQLKLNEKDDEIKKLTEQLEQMTRKLDDTEASGNKFTSSSAMTYRIVQNHSDPTKDMVASKDGGNDIYTLKDLNEDVGVLFDERDALASRLHEFSMRISDFEDDRKGFNAIIIRRMKKLEDGVEDETSKITALINLKASENEKQRESDIAKIVETGRNSESVFKDAVEDLHWKITNGCQRTLEETASIQESLKARIDVLDRQTHQRIAGVEDLIGDRIEESALRCREHIALAEQKAKVQTDDFDKRAQNRIAVIQQEVKEVHEKVKQHAEEKAATALLAASSLINQVEQRTVGRVEDIDWHANRQMVDHSHRMGERIDKLEDLVRALTLQNAMQSPPATQLIAVRASNGQTLDLCVPKGSPLVPAKNKENVRSFTPGRQWMD